VNVGLSSLGEGVRWSKQSEGNGEGLGDHVELLSLLNEILVVSIVVVMSKFVAGDKGCFCKASAV
jgi:hypothetical protein